jgi:DNA polymerase III subunit alpha
VTEVYRDRMEYELTMMNKMGFAAYFLVVWDYIKFARDSNIPVGPGRGSAAGSLVAYAMAITNIDPVHHGLLFERFLNPERKSMPDIDTDFCIEKREKVIEYVTEKYGTARVAQIITFNRLTSKAVLKDVARVLNIPYSESDKMAKLIPVSRGKPAKLKVMISDETPAPEFKERYDKNFPIPNCESQATYRQWLDMAIRIEGTNKSFGVHAAGVVISKDPLDEIVPLQRNNDGAVITQYYMEDIDAIGLLKMDFLGLKNLTMIEKAVNYIEQNGHGKIDIDRIPSDDPKSFKLLERGDLEGIFQLESSGMRQIVRDLKPSNLDDISSILALYRPGPLDAGLIPKFIDRKHGREAIDYPHEIIKPILTETYGIMVYQEQIMRIAQDMGGYSLGQADLLRRAMGKKKKAEMEKHKAQFVQGAEERGVSKTIANDLFEQMILFAEYCFNKSHSFAYAYVTFQTAYLKANHPVEYMAALLTVNSGQQDKLQRYIANCIDSKIEVDLPDVNKSGVDFTPTGNRILFGLSAIRNLGEGAIESLITSRIKDGHFLSLADLCNRLDSRTINRRALEALIHSGALDKIEPNSNRKQLFSDLPFILDWAQSRARDRESGQGNLFDLIDSNDSDTNAIDVAPKSQATSEYEPQERLKLEKELLGFYVSNHPLRSIQQAARVLAPINLGNLEDYVDRGKVSCLVMIAEKKDVRTKKDVPMAILQLEDLSGKIEAVVFPKSYERIFQHLQLDARLMIWGKVDRRDEQIQFIVEDAEPVESIRFVTVEIDMNQARDGLFQRQLMDLIQSQRSDPQTAKVPVIAVIKTAGRHQLVRLGANCRVQDSETTVQAMRQQSFIATSKQLLTPAGLA